MPVLSGNSIRAGLLVIAFADKAIAQPISDAELTRRQAQQQEQAQSRIANSPDVFTQTGAKNGAGFLLPAETPCFPIHTVEWRGAGAFDWMVADGAAISHNCIGAQGLRAFQDHLTRQLIERGYITSRVLIPEQNLSSGSLAVQVVAGRIGMIREQGSVPGMIRMALPDGEGGLLNQRDLDQALENIRRLAGQQAVEFDLVPGAKPGETDIVVKHPDARRWRGLLTLDDSGAQSTGKYQLGGVLTFDSPLRLYDSLTLALNRNANFGNNMLGTNSSSTSWSVPFGYWSFLLGANQSRYKQTVAGFSGDIVYSGRSHGMEIGIGHVPYRTASAKGALQFKLDRKVSRSRIDDADIDVQFRDVVGYEAGFSHRQYLGDSTLDLGIGIKGSLPHQSNAPGLIVGAPDWDGRYRIETASAGIVVPLQLAGQQLRYRREPGGERERRTRERRRQRRRLQQHACRCRQCRHAHFRQ